MTSVRIRRAVFTFNMVVGGTACEIHRTLLVTAGALRAQEYGDCTSPDPAVWVTVDRTGQRAIWGHWSAADPSIFSPSEGFRISDNRTQMRQSAPWRHSSIS